MSGFLTGQAAAEEYVKGVREKGPYSGYNLVMGDLDGLYYYSNRSDRMVRLAPGIHGLSNHLLDTPWPKVVRGKQELARVLGCGNFSSEDIFAILADGRQAPDEQLPDTGVGRDLERLLSSIFIKSERYGTRSSSILLVDRDCRATFVERNFDGATPRDVKIGFDWSRQK